MPSQAQPTTGRASPICGAPDVDIPAFAACIVILALCLVALAMHSLLAAALVVLALVAGVAVWSVWPEVGNDDGEVHP